MNLTSIWNIRALDVREIHTHIIIHIRISIIFQILKAANHNVWWKIPKDPRNQERVTRNSKIVDGANTHVGYCVTYDGNPFVSAEIPLALAYIFLYLSRTRHLATPLAPASLGALLMFQDKYQIQTTMQLSLCTL